MAHIYAPYVFDDYEIANINLMQGIKKILLIKKIIIT
jgi:hypothetical protein